MSKYTGYMILLALVLMVAEVLSYFSLSLDHYWIRNRVYWPPAASEDEFQVYMTRRDSLLGWPPHDPGIQPPDYAARPSPANLELPHMPICASVYGNSYVYSDEEDDQAAWPNVLAETLQCQVRNFGVSGYGVDQAVLLFEQNVRDTAGFTILGVYPDDINRNMNQWHYLLWGGDIFTFKPSFMLHDSDLLVLVELPVNSFDALKQTFRAPEDTLLYEHYLPGESVFLSRVRVSFPYSWTVLLMVRKILFQIDWGRFSISREMRYWNYPVWYDSPQGPSPQKISLNSMITNRFAALCQTRQRRCVILVIPDIDMIATFREDGSNLFGPVVGRIKGGLEIWDATEFFANHTEAKGECYFIGINRDCKGHFNEEGYTLLADFVVEKMSTKSAAIGRED